MDHAIKSGWVHKKGKKTYSQFRSRFMILCNNKKIEYYTNNSLSNMKGQIDLFELHPESVQVSNKTPKGEMYGFKIITKDRVWYFAVEKQSDCNEWISVISKSIRPTQKENKQKNNNDNNVLSNDEKYNKQPKTQATEQENNDQLEPTQIALSLMSIYRTLLDINNDSEKADRCTKSLVSLYDNYYEIKAKIMKKGNDKILHKIYLQLMSINNDDKCNPNQCKYITYHYRDRTSNQFQKNNNSKLHIFEDLLANIHCFVLHPFDLNFCTSTDNDQVSQQQIFKNPLDVDAINSHRLRIQKKYTNTNNEHETLDYNSKTISSKTVHNAQNTQNT
eukprot:401796_1